MHFSVPVQTAAWRIFHHMWHVRTAREFLLTELDLVQFGVHGGKLTESQTREKMGEVAELYLPIAAIADLYYEGAWFELIQPKDAVSMYRDIKEHLEECAHVHTTAIDGIVPPKTDLEKLDALNREIYKVALMFMTTDAPSGEFFDFVTSMRVNKRRILLGNHKENVLLRAPDKYVSPIAVAFTKPAAFKGGRQWQ